MRKLVIFDFDGTLVDTVTDVALCFNTALAQCGYPQHPLAAFDRFVGGNLETVVSRMLPPQRCTQADIDAVKTVYRTRYLQSEKPNTRPYPGILELLTALKAEGFWLAVNSNKGQQLLDDMVDKLFPPAFFDAVVGYQEDRPSKPDPWGVDEICRRCGCSRFDAVYVGDGGSDIATAAAAGVPCVYVTWGQGSEETRRDPRIARTVADAAALEQALHTEL